MQKVSQYRILLVEDEALLRQTLAHRINQLDIGFEVVAQAGDGQEALELLPRSNIHLVMTDIRMPLMNGLALCKSIHEQFPSIYTVVLTSYADFTYAQEAIKQGVSDYLLKPISQEDLESALIRIRLELQKTLQLEEDPSQFGKDAEEIVEQLALYLRSNYMQDIDFSTLCADLGFSSAYLSRLFQKFKQETPLKYLTAIRIHEAQHLLANTALPIREVGERVGYPNQFHFSKTFRKATGMTPSTYRKQETGMET